MSFDKVPQLDLDRNDLWKGDLFGREGLTATVVNLLKQSSKPVVIGVHGPYGFGKTFFLQRLSEQIKKEGWCVYVNAWEYDYLDNPTLALLDTLKVAATEAPNSTAAIRSLKTISAAAAPAFVKGISKKALGMALGDDGTTELLDAISGGSEKAAEKLIENALKGDSTRQSINTFREKVREFVEGNKVSQSGYPCLIVVVDELDRARPNFAITFLEVIKHLFATAQVIFVIGCDRDIISSSAKHQFGNELPVDGYLRRLFDYWIDLPEPDRRKYVVECARRLEVLGKILVEGSDNAHNGAKAYAENLVTAAREKASLRFIEQSVAHALVVWREYPGEVNAGLLGFLQGVLVADKDFYELYSSNGHPARIYRALIDKNYISDADDHLGAWMAIWATNRRLKLNEQNINTYFHDYPKIRERLIQSLKFGRLEEFVDDRRSIANQMGTRLRSIVVN